jgi:hypothetical protein
MTPPRMLLAALIAVGAVAAQGSPAVAQTEPQPGITVFANDGSVATTFDVAKCSVGKNGKGKRFKADAKSHGWTLMVRLNDFTGYDDEYDLKYGIGTNNFIVKSPGGTHYTNMYEPDFPINPVGGAVAFSGGKKKVVMGLGFIAAFSAVGATDGSDGIALGGRAACKAPKKK